MDLKSLYLNMTSFKKVNDRHVGCKLCHTQDKISVTSFLQPNAHHLVHNTLLDSLLSQYRMQGRYYSALCILRQDLYRGWSLNSLSLIMTRLRTRKPNNLVATIVQPCIARCVFYITNEMQLTQFSLLLSALYMFRAVFPSIIRSL